MAGATLLLASPEQLLRAIAASCYSLRASLMAAHGDNAFYIAVKPDNKNDDNTLGAAQHEHVK
jgi:organic hydroperoxide reductase OsmC/OhrA